ncbi:MAG: hypothetical protein KJN99_03695 [Marinicaulis sp.]|nr:hypothetical protein [Marinicaulis sp.]
MMSRGWWFPAPLFFLHAALVFYHLATGLYGFNSFWVSAFMSRAFDAALFYVIGCGLYTVMMRIYRSGH